MENKLYVMRNEIYKLIATATGMKSDTVLYILASIDGNYKLRYVNQLPAVYKQKLVKVTGGTVYVDKENNCKVAPIEGILIDNGLGEYIMKDASGKPLQIGKTYHNTLCSQYFKLYEGSGGHARRIVVNYLAISPDWLSDDMCMNREFHGRLREVTINDKNDVAFTLFYPPYGKEDLNNIPLDNFLIPVLKKDMSSRQPTFFFTSTLSNVSVSTDVPIIIDDNNIITLYDVLSGKTQDYFICEDCGEIVHNRDKNNLVNRPICKSCFKKNYKYLPFEEAYVKKTSIVLMQGQLYSENYAREHFHICNKCGCYYISDDKDSKYCEHCRNFLIGQPSNKDSIEEYGYKPTPVFRKQEDENDAMKYIGMEWELDTFNYIAGESNKIAEYMFASSRSTSPWYCKEDGSLACGFEAVSHPMTVNYLLNNIDFSRYCQMAIKYGFEEASSAGIHFHVSRTFFNGIGNIGHIIRFFEENYYDIVRLVGREPCKAKQWAAYYDLTESELDDPVETYNAAEDIGSRYKAVNIKNANTVEFRIFPSVLDPNKIRAFIQFIDILTNLANQAVYIISFENIKLLANKKNYIELLNLLEVHSL